MIESRNPATGELLQTFEEMSDEKLEAALVNATSVFETFGRRDKLEQRLECLKKLGGLLRSHSDEIARLITMEMGKPIVQAEAEVEKSASCCDYYVQNTKRILESRAIKTGHSKSYIRWLPVGPVLAVMPWNYPLWQVIRFAAPALAAGNPGLLKHASNVPQMALKVEELCLEAGFPVGAFQTLLIGSSRIEKLIDDDRVKGVTLTGSEPAGRAVAAQAGRNIKPSLLELGGSDPFIVMPSADLKKAVQLAVKARVMNTGQSCIGAKRFIVHERIFNEFIDRFIAALHEQSVGNPLHRETTIGPLATSGIRDELTKQVADTVAAGGDVAFAGSCPEGEGYWYPPTVLTHIPEDSPAYKDELFGPVASVFSVADISEAISLANATRFGLGSAAWTQDDDERYRFINELEAGFTAINGMTSSDPRLPFGGVKASGYGRELADMGMHAFMNAKTVTIG
jgi:succinate-semialdehyde dehydrogenase/glutarate-semialdehyde dehydrogenase